MNFVFHFVDVGFSMESFLGGPVEITKSWWMRFFARFVINFPGLDELWVESTGWWISSEIFPIRMYRNCRVAWEGPEATWTTFEWFTCNRHRRQWNKTDIPNSSEKRSEWTFINPFNAKWTSTSNHSIISTAFHELNLMQGYINYQLLRMCEWACAWNEGWLGDGLPLWSMGDAWWFSTRKRREWHQSAYGENPKSITVNDCPSLLLCRRCSLAFWWSSAEFSTFSHRKFI